MPSEGILLGLDDVDPRDHTLVVTEPKKGYCRRTVYIEPTWLASSPTRLSLANWLCWREKLEPTTDALFPHLDGGDWPSKAALATWIKKRAKPHHPWFNFRMGRHWCATARLIAWGYDYDRVAEWLGHENTDKVHNRYARSARVFEKRYGANWIERAFKRPPHPEPSCTDEPASSGSPVRSPPGENREPTRPRTRSQRPARR